MQLQCDYICCGGKNDDSSTVDYRISFAMTYQESSPTRKNLTPNELSVNTRSIDRLSIGWKLSGVVQVGTEKMHLSRSKEPNTCES